MGWKKEGAWGGVGGVGREAENLSVLGDRVINLLVSNT